MSQREFNLEQALAGHPVVTRDGRAVTQLVKFDCYEERTLYGVVGGYIYKWLGDGRASNDDAGFMTLFMAPVKKTGWVARVEAGLVAGIVLPTEDECKAWYPDAISYHKIEWEE